MTVAVLIAATLGRSLTVAVLIAAATINRSIAVAVLIAATLGRSLTVAVLIAATLGRSLTVAVLIAATLGRSLTVAVLMALVVAMFPAPGLAQSTDGYKVTWHTVDGGGIMHATGNGYKVGGTIGQPDAGKLTGGAYAVAGGFWALAPACPASNPPLSEATVPDAGFGTRVRYLSFTGGTPGAQEAVRVAFADMPANPPYYDFIYAEGRQMWVGQPYLVSEVAGRSDATPPTFWVATLQCDPYFTDWSAYSAVHVLGESIVPRAKYDLQLVTMGCETAEANYSTALPVNMSKWGDAVGANNAASPQGTVDFNDISSVVDKFKNLPGAPSKSRVDVAPSLLDRIIDFVDIPAVVDAFKGRPYPYAGPPVVEPCP